MFLKKQDPRKPARWKGRSKAVPRKSTSTQSHSWRQIQWIFIVSPKVNENHHLDGVPHLDPLGSGQVKPMANPGWLFSDCWLCSRVLYMLQILFKSNSANINQTDGLAHCSLARGHLMKEITSPTLSLCSCSKPPLVVYCKNRMVPIPNTSYIDPWFP